MDWRFLIAMAVAGGCSTWAGVNGGELARSAHGLTDWLLYAGLPVSGAAGAAWYASGRAAVKAKDRSLEIMAELVRELTQQGRLQNVTSTGAKFAVEFKQEGKA